MPLASGTRLGPYEVLAEIGAGGMGAVYKARDTRLDRAVALKVIQPAVAGDPDMRERFEREARAISALDHPHICILYDVCRESIPAAGPAGSGQVELEHVSFLVMQYLEGETLADRLARTGKPRSDPSRPPAGADSALTTMSRGPIPFDTALKYAVEIAHALDAAHRRGIVHRDLKPGNIMLTKSGTKLLDFGLAKLAAAERGIGGLGDGATRTSPLTSQGAILGTLSYMSPEQLEGRDVDARADIFAFGAMLYEMLTGRRAFDGDSQASIIGAIMAGHPPAASDLADARATLPIVSQRALDRLLARCLAKHPDERWQSAADLAAELQWISEERLRAVSEPATDPRATTIAVDGRSRRRERIWMAAAGLAIAGLAAWAAMWYARSAPAQADPVSFAITAPEGYTFANGPGLLGMSPDGRRLAFVTSTSTGSDLELWVRDIGSLEAELVRRGTGAWHPFWSPDSRSVAYAGLAGAVPLRKIDPSGGTPMTLSSEAAGRGAWSPSGIVLFRGADGKLYQVADSGGQPSLAMDLDATRVEGTLDWPMFLPDGRRYLFLARSGADASKNAIFLASLDGPGRTHIVDALSNVDYADGFLFYHREGTLLAHPFDPHAGRPTGDALPVIEDIRYNAANGRGAFSVASNGTIAYVPGTDITDISRRTLILLDRAGKAVQQVGGPGSYVGATLSPDGRQLVVTQDSNQEPVLRRLTFFDVERGVSTPFTVGDVDERSPVWSPDSASIVFASVRDGNRGVYRRHAGGGATRDDLLFSSPDAVAPTSISPGGKLLLMTRGIASNQRLWVLPLEGDRKPVELLPGSTVAAYQGTFSPDGRWIAYTAGTSQSDAEIYVQSYPPDERRIRISTATGRFPYWTADGRQIIYRTTDDAIVSVAISEAGGTLRPSTPVPLFTQRRTSGNNWFFSMDPRGERFALVVPPETAEPERATPPITVIVNWTAGLKRRP